MYSLNLSRSNGLSSNSAGNTASLPNAQTRAISPRRASSSQPYHGSHVSLAPRSSNPIGGAGVIVSGAHSAALLQKQEEMLNVTSEHFKVIEAKLEAMHAELKKLDAASTAAPPQARTASPNFAPTAFRQSSAQSPANSSTAPAAATASARPSVPGAATTPRPHHLKPLEADAGGSTGAPLPMPPSSVASAAAPAPAPAAEKKHKAARPAPGGEFGFEMPAMLDSPDGSSSDDDDDDDSDDNSGSESSPTHAQKQKAASPTATAAAAGNRPSPPPPRQGVGFNGAGGRASPTAGAAAAARSPVGRQAVGFAKPEAPKTGGNGAAAAGGGGGGRGRRGIQMNPDEAGADAGKALDGRAGGPMPPAVGAAAAGGRRLSGDEGVAMAVGRGIGGAAAETEHDDARAVDGMDRATKRHNAELTKNRETFFNGIPRLSELFKLGTINRKEMEAMSLPGAPCSWLACAALVISYITEIPTSVEKILRTNHLGVHYIALPGVTLAQFYDLVNDYIHTRFHRNVSYNGVCADDEFNEDDEAAHYLTPEQITRLQDVHCEMAMFSKEIIDPMDTAGEHPPITSLAQFRRELVEHIGEANSLYVFNYDPYVIESNEARLRSNMAETEEEMQEIMENLWYAPNGKGNFGILTDFNPVRHTVTILTPHLLRDTDGHTSHDDESRLLPEQLARRQRFRHVMANLGMEEHTISIQTLYDAVMKQDVYTGLSRGFVRIMISEKFAPKVKPIFPLFVVDGSSAGGLMTSGLHMSIAPHVLGLAMLHHLTVTFLLTDSARRKQSSRNLLSKANVCDVKLRGIPLTKIVQQLRLPMSMIVGESSPSSLAMAFAWYHVFLQQLQVNQDVRLGLVLPSRRGGADDGMPNIFEEDFTEHLRLVIKTSSIMLISFDVNKAQNMRITDTPTAHFGIVIGFDEERSLVRLADVNVRRYGKTWTLPLSRLYNATMGFGYMVAAQEKKTIKALKGKEFQDEALSSAKYRLPPQVEVDTRFEYPAQPYPLTVLADSVDRLGFYANVGRFLNYSGYHISYFLSSHMPLHGAAAVLQNYSHYATDDAFSAIVTHYDYSVQNPVPADAPPNPLHVVHTEDTLRAAIEDALAKPDLCRLLVKIDQQLIREDPNTWNGSRSGGSYALVLQYEPMMNNVVLLNCDPSSFYRTFSCPLGVLYKALCAFDEDSLRACGTLLLTREFKQESYYVDTKGYDMAHALVHHPFKPIFSSACSCLALAATEMMVNIEGPTLLGGAPLQVAEDDSRKYKRYNNVFSAEDFLYELPAFSVHDWTLHPELGQDVVAMATEAFAGLNLPLLVEDVLKSDPTIATDAEAFLEALEGPGGILTITLVAYDTDLLHGVPGSSVGLVNRVELAGADESHTVQAGSAGAVQLIEGDPCRWGSYIQCSVEELMRACIGIYCVQERVEYDEEQQE